MHGGIWDGHGPGLSTEDLVEFQELFRVVLQAAKNELTSIVAVEKIAKCQVGKLPILICVCDNTQRIVSQPCNTTFDRKHTRMDDCLLCH